jgi:hypothetical protein
LLSSGKVKALGVRNNCRLWAEWRVQDGEAGRVEGVNFLDEKLY